MLRSAFPPCFVSCSAAMSFPSSCVGVTSTSGLRGKDQVSGRSQRRDLVACLVILLPTAGPLHRCAANYRTLVACTALCAPPDLHGEW